jgi:hypothetical protein
MTLNNKADAWAMTERSGVCLSLKNIRARHQSVVESDGERDASQARIALRNEKCLTGIGIGVMELWSFRGWFLGFVLFLDLFELRVKGKEN